MECNGLNVFSVCNLFKVYDVCMCVCARHAGYARYTLYTCAMYLMHARQVEYRMQAKYLVHVCAGCNACCL